MDCDGGVIRLLELHCNRLMHWFVCLLHMNELPLRHLLIHLDGVMLGPNSFSCPIGKAIAPCSNAVAQFQPIQGNALSYMKPGSLSNNKKNRYDMHNAILS